VNFMRNCTLVVESEQNDAIEKAHDKAEELFAQISKVNSGRGVYTFVVAPDNLGNLSEYTLLEGVAQQVFLDWCEGENSQGDCPVFKVRQMHY